jgi:hypothetical protein
MILMPRVGSYVCARKRSRRCRPPCPQAAACAEVQTSFFKGICRRGRVAKKLGQKKSLMEGFNRPTIKKFQSEFTCHYITKSNHRNYDPSYGDAVANSLKEYENSDFTFFRKNGSVRINCEI